MLKAVLMFVAVLSLALTADSAFAQEAAEAGASAPEAAEFLPLIGSGLIVIGAAIGIGMIGSSAVASMARQPESAGKIQTAMIIAAALIEGLGFAALFVGR